ncbi:MAG: hypothetical protein HUK02_10490, partial [Bacteroidaceae bacterium]|nr:hypothetical protein [Bacteroidaceae bacterium]
AEQQLAEAAANETQQLIALQRSQLQAEATQLADLVALLQQSLQQCTSTALLQKALQAGEIGIVEFLQDRAAYYSLQDQWQEAQHDYQTALARWQFLQ